MCISIVTDVFVFVLCKILPIKDDLCTVCGIVYQATIFLLYVIKLGPPIKRYWWSVNIFAVGHYAMPIRAINYGHRWRDDLMIFEVSFFCFLPLLSFSKDVDKRPPYRACDKYKPMSFLYFCSRLFLVFSLVWFHNMNICRCGGFVTCKYYLMHLRRTYFEY